ncbi:putative alkaline shock family protein YloU [Nakamurella sp. UYEF19]|uniref:Asp23/Gls24 family envelope stress response protein n=1 Tax=Nakamurella sp. UYEF19 TaxID=1756392 RepID=UPI003392A08B
MTTTAPDAVGPGTTTLAVASGTAAGVIAPDFRGTTTLADRVVQKIAARAAQEIPGCVGLHRRVVGIRTGRSAVAADAVTDGSITGLRIAVGIAYPAPITTTTRQIRAHVRDTVERLCDLSVDHVDIDVAEVSRPAVERRRVR